MKFIRSTIWFTVLGLLLAITVLIWNGSSLEGSPFHEWRIKRKKLLVDSVLTKRIRILNLKFHQLDSLVQQDSKVFDSIQEATNKAGTKVFQLQKAISDKQDELKNITGLLESTIKDRNMLRSSNFDTASSYYTQFFFVDRDSLFKLFNNPDSLIDSTYLSDSVRFLVIDPTLISSDSNYKELIVDTALLEKRPFDSKISFFSKYPIFGFWYILSITLICVWVMVGVIIVLMTIDALK